jgi:hypothetical protein
LSRLSLRERRALPDFATMKPPLAHLSSPIVPATLAAAIGASLSVFLLPASGVQVEPTPLLPAIGEVVGRVAADLPAAAKKVGAPPVRQVAPSAQLAPTRTEHFVPKPREVAGTAVVARAPSVPAPAGTPAPLRRILIKPSPAPKLIAGAPAPLKAPEHKRGKK